MKPTKTLLCGILALSTLSSSAFDYKEARKARQLQKDKRYEEAIAVYENLSKKTKNVYDDQRYMVLAIKIALYSLKDREKAIKLAESIKNPERRAYVLMSLYKPETLIEKYKETDFMTWPEDLRVAACKNRGEAYFKLKKYQEALVDLEQALSIQGGSPRDRGEAARIAGDIYLDNMKNEAKAEAMYRKALAATRGNYSWRNNALLRLSDILLRNKKNKDALAIYQNSNLDKIKIPFWKITIARGHAKALAANGKNLEALKQLNMALQTETNPDRKKNIQKEIDKLSEDML